MAVKKYYVVWKGLDPGIYTSWEECKKQIEGFEGAQYKAFKTRELAEVAFNADYEEFRGMDTRILERSDEDKAKYGDPEWINLAKLDPALMEKFDKAVAQNTWIGE